MPATINACNYKHLSHQSIPFPPSQNNWAAPVRIRHLPPTSSHRSKISFAIIGRRSIIRINQNLRIGPGRFSNGVNHQNIPICSLCHRHPPRPTPHATISTYHILSYHIMCIMFRSIWCTYVTRETLWEGLPPPKRGPPMRERFQKKPFFSRYNYASSLFFPPDICALM